MAERISAGTILTEEGVIFPDSFRVESEPYSNGWRILKHLDGYGLDRRIRETGWTSFYMAGEIQASAVALNGEKSVRRAVNRILTKLKSERFNSLEITHVAVKRFLGLSHTTVSAHARHVQESMFLFDWMEKQTTQPVHASSDEKTASHAAQST